MFLVIISAFPPLSIDLYLPAMPQMVENFSTTQAMVNLTLSLYFVTYAIGLLFWGPLSEKYGRKPILMTGFSFFIVTSLICSIATNIEMLIVTRMFQAFGGSAVTVVATALVKDLYDGRQREKVMATVMSLSIIAPVVAPVLGAFLLQIASWKMIFVVLAGVGIVSVLITLCFNETLIERYSGSIVSSWSRLGTVLKNPGFVSLLGIFALGPMGLMAFLALASYIYIDGFGLTEQEFSFAFSFNAVCATIAPLAYIKLSKYFSVQNIILCSYASMVFFGIAIATLGQLSPWWFALLAAPATITVIVIEVPSMNLMLEQQDQDVGSATALIQFFMMMMGAVGMFLVSLNPDYLIESLGAIICLVGLIAGSLWFVVRNRDFVTEKVPQ